MQKSNDRSKVTSASRLDELDVRSTLEPYMRHSDDRDLGRMVDLFEPDAEYHVLGEHLVGHAAIAGFLIKSGFQEIVPNGGRVASDDDHRPVSVHLLANPVIVMNDDEADAVSDFVTCYRDTNGEPKLEWVGRYRDQLHRGADGQWRFSKRWATALPRRGERGENGGARPDEASSS